MTYDSNLSTFVPTSGADFPFFDLDVYCAAVNQAEADSYSPYSEEIPDEYFEDPERCLGFQLKPDHWVSDNHPRSRYRRKDGSQAYRRKNRMFRFDYNHRMERIHRYGFCDDCEWSWSDVHSYFEDAEQVKEDPKAVWVRNNLVEHNVTYIDGCYYINGEDVTDYVNNAMHTASSGGRELPLNTAAA